MMRAMLVALLLAIAGPAFAQPAQPTEPAKGDPRIEDRLKGLAEELRCLVCQNQTIADSNAPLAVDLRQQIRDQVAQGRSDAQIRDYMVQRYGDFVLYKPPFKATTALLWLAPLLLLALGAFIFFMTVRARRVPPADIPATDARRAEIERLLE